MMPHTAQHNSNRAAAQSLGEKHFVGDPCGKGHTTHYSCNAECVQCTSDRMKIQREAAKTRWKNGGARQVHSKVNASHRIETSTERVHHPMTPLPVVGLFWKVDKSRLMAGK